MEVPPWEVPPWEVPPFSASALERWHGAAARAGYSG
jgi:hypothetical protein